MRIWISSRRLIFAGLRGHKPRCYSAVTNNVERVNVRLGLTGGITIDLHNIAKASPQSPLLIYLPPFSTAFADKPAPLPKFIRGQPTAVINYRWNGFSPFQTRKPATPTSTDESDKEEFSPILSWPAPIHDTSAAYDWIVQNLGPSGYARRDIYLYGSYLGATLATSLALTETHPHAPVAVRGCIALNGIYDWTRFLPDHRMNNPPKRGTTLKGSVSRSNDPHFQELKQHVEALFVSPSGLFDPFASPTLFFRTPDLLVPPNFTTSALSPEASSLANVSLPNPMTGEPTLVLTHPSKKLLVFPPRTSTLKIPKTLLLYTKKPSSLVRLKREDSFQTQAQELGWFMSGRVNKMGLDTRNKWDEYDSWEDSDVGTVRVHNVGPSSGDYALNSKGEELAATWLEDHTS
ncbi:hypothetical protein F5Y00DRAFT_49990 [Daldinia vernicosa]|uniref:uncharacterized protein n=1 Tax=Daldinia vernicosa TaxID=114800 RepID=UPI0020083203|nr:uncharacterized protein F5Y00DRAFT_49990 [Daldinia vernicosa]KAI0849762.1 hypothetical protein F5Y00DRAFT_49990 [Daldinia vernicosa]